MNDMPQDSAPFGASDDLPKRRIARVVSGTTLTMALAVLPTFLVSGLVVLIREDLGISAAQLGLSVSAFSVMAALCSVPGGRLNDRGGGYRGMLVALGFAAVSLLGLGAVADHWIHLAVFLGFGGIAQAFAASATNLSLLRGLPNRYQGLGFGIKTSAIPVASMAAGLALPAIGLTAGWRWAFLGAVGIVALTALLLAPEERRASGPRRINANRAGVVGDIKPLVAMAVAAGVSTAAGTAMMAFWVVSAVVRGVPAGLAGLWLSAGSVVGIVGRVAWGRYIDRTGRRPLSATAVLLAAGAAGLLIVALTTHPALLVLATLLVFGGGWSWTGLFHLALVRNYRATPAAATGITQLGMRSGGIVGPTGFGLLAEYASYEAAWACAAGFLAAGAVLMGSASRTLSRSTATAATAGPTDDDGHSHDHKGRET